MRLDEGNRGLSQSIRWSGFPKRVVLTVLAALSSWMLPGSWHLVVGRYLLAVSLLIGYLLIPVLISFWVEVPAFGVIVGLFAMTLACRIAAALDAVRSVFGFSGLLLHSREYQRVLLSSLAVTLMCFIAWQFAPQPISLVYVSSQAMEPTIHKGESIVVRNLAFPGFPQLKVGDIVVFRRDIATFDDIKRISASVCIDKQRPSTEVRKGYEVIGDNKDASYDSRAFGVVPENRIKALALYIAWSPDQTRIGKQL